MTLSKDEQRRLDEIETLIGSTDPGFAARLDFPAERHRRAQRTAVAWCGFLVGLFIMMVGAATAQGLISIGSIICCYGFIILVCAAVTAVRNHTRS